MKKKLLLFLCLVMIGLASMAQQPSAERQRMENERRAIQKELADLKEQYSKIHGRTKATLGQLAAIRHRMEVQEQLLRSIDREIHILNDDIYLSTLELNRLQRQLDSLKAQYAKSVIYAYKNRSSYDYLTFVFSAQSFNDALKRVRYLRSYRLYRQSQLTTIRETQKAIEDRKAQLLAKKADKSNVLKEQTSQYNELEDQRKEKDRVAAQLQSQEKELSKQLAAKRKRDNQLKLQIATVIRREAERREAERREAARKEAERIAAENKRREAENKAAAAAGKPVPPPVKKPVEEKPKSFEIYNAEERALAATFEKNRGSLPWPVDNGRVSIPYGRSKVGGLDFDNPGITIETPNPGAGVKAVFDGEVTQVTNTADAVTVMVSHGQYLTVYANLSSASVSRGQTVRRGQSIGTSGPADDGSGGQVDFLIYNGKVQLNPSSWLRR